MITTNVLFIVILCAGIGSVLAINHYQILSIGVGIGKEKMVSEQL